VTTPGVDVRRPAAAGTFYPRDPGELARMVDALLDEAAATSTSGEPPEPVALIAPHAGYVYSGVLAAAAHRLTPQTRPRRVVVLAPAHTVPLRCLAVPSATAFATPLGEVPVDTEACRELISVVPEAVTDDLAHVGEHAVEVHLPFLQRVRPDGWTLVPVVVGATTAAVVAAALDVLCADSDSLPVVSTDLSHYLDQAAAAERDRHTVEAVLRLDDTGIGPSDACGRYALRGLLLWAARRHLEVTSLGWSTSAVASGDRSRVVGYAAFALTSPRPS
jgi:AmmeMemoRadiSam system protein B